MVFKKKETGEVVEENPVKEKTEEENKDDEKKSRPVTIDDLIYEILSLKQRVSELEATNQRVRGAY